jgi:four helix bundle protein
MQKRDPEGYRKLLAYQKAQALHNDVLEMVKHFPQLPYRHTHYRDNQIKTIGDLADQMSRSGRSTHKNIVEGWKRTTTQEYFDFLSYSIGSNSELQDDAADTACGKYKELMGVRGIMGERGQNGLPLSPLNPLPPFTIQQLNSLGFYPLDQTLPPVVKIFLKAKEVDYLLHRLQLSLDAKMDNDHAKPVNQKVREKWSKEKLADVEFKKYLKDSGLIRLENGRYVSKEELAKMEKEKSDKGETGGIPLFPE